jgi:undecaprenyl-diphosphatase
METSILVWLAANRIPPLDAVASLLTVAGRGGLILVALALIRAVVNRRLAMAAWQTILAVLLAALLANSFVKPLVARPRPYVTTETLTVVGDRPTGDSFPSGHAAACIAGAFLLASTWPAARAWLWALAAAVALSRMYVGAHYPSDVLGGALIGWAVAWFVRGRTVWRIDPAGRAA